LIVPLLLIGGAFLCFEGAEKIVHKFSTHAQSDSDTHHQELLEAVSNQNIDLVQYEKDKIKGAIRTDFILSAEIIVITLGAAAASTFWVQVGTLSAVALIMTVGVYGFVAGIVKLDDAGLHLIRKPPTHALARARHAFGHFLLWLAPKLMRFLSIAGTAAMFLVGGGILVHNIAVLHHAVEGIANTTPALDWLISGLLQGLTGVLLGLAVVLLVSLYNRLFRRKTA
jgi:predicted DNA repair protein MutK